VVASAKRRRRLRSRRHGYVGGAMTYLVRHVMASPPKVALPTMTALDAAGLMASHDIGSVPIVDEEHLVGIVTDRDLVVRVLASRQDPSGVALGDIATRKDLVTISPDDTVAEARTLMAEHRVKRLPVVKGDELVGIVSFGDVAQALSSSREVGEAVRAITESPETTRIADDGPTVGTPQRVRDQSN
jgi:CBS domain-containing protein